jgi:Xaa-Pro aminopeptidase
VTEPNYSARRQRAARLLGKDAALIIAASPEIVIGDAELRYVVDPDLYWLTGYAEPEAVLVLCPRLEDEPFTMFVRPRDPGREVWNGARAGTEGAIERFGANAAHPIAALPEKLPALLDSVSTVYARVGAGRRDFDETIGRVLERGRRLRQRKGHGPRALVDPGVILDDLRLIKDADELALMRTAADISVEVFREASAVIGAGTGEWQVEATIDGGFRVRGASGPAFPTIVASGPNAIVLHHIANDRTMESADLVLLDAGARHAMYCADITRTFPVAGRFGGARKALYETVLRAHDAAIARARPGATIEDVHEAARDALLAGAVDCGLLKGPLERLREEEGEYSRLYPHRTSHWLGLDVHDVGDYVRDGRARVLEPGMVFTVEPGLYVPVDWADGPTELRGTGVRIEDDVLITPGGHEVLTGGLPADVDGIEALLD